MKDYAIPFVFSQISQYPTIVFTMSMLSITCLPIRDLIFEDCRKIAGVLCITIFTHYAKSYFNSSFPCNNITLGSSYRSVKKAVYWLKVHKCMMNIFYNIPKRKIYCDVD